LKGIKIHQNLIEIEEKTLIITELKT